MYESWHHGELETDAKSTCNCADDCHLTRGKHQNESTITNTHFDILREMDNETLYV